MLHPALKRSPIKSDVRQQARGERISALRLQANGPEDAALKASSCETHAHQGPRRTRSLGCRALNPVSSRGRGGQTGACVGAFGVAAETDTFDST